MIHPIHSLYFMGRFGVSGTLLIMGGLSFHGVIFSSALKLPPLSVRTRGQETPQRTRGQETHLSVTTRQQETSLSVTTRQQETSLSDITRQQETPLSDITRQHETPLSVTTRRHETPLSVTTRRHETPRQITHTTGPVTNNSDIPDGKHLTTISGIIEQAENEARCIENHPKSDISDINVSSDDNITTDDKQSPIVIDTNEGTKCEESCSRKKGNIEGYNIDGRTHIFTATNTTKKHCLDSVMTYFAGLLDFTPLRKPQFVLCAFYFMLTRMSKLGFITHIVSCAKYRGVPEDAAGYLLTIMGFSQLVSLVISSLLMNLSSVRIPLVFCSASVLISSAMFCAAFSDSYALLVTSSILLGIGSGTRHIDTLW